MKNMIIVPASSFFPAGTQYRSIADPQGKLFVPDFFMDIFPVTNAAYKAVIPSWDYRPGTKEHPATGMCYEDILEYCQKVDKRLPSEIEWEKCARGDLDQRAYPWGNRFSSAHCNCRRFFRKSDIKPVTAFPSGVGPYGHLDLAGNAWEWTVTEGSESTLILKGGSCSSPSRRHLRISARIFASPKSQNAHFGFRCCRDA